MNPTRCENCDGEVTHSLEHKQYVMERNWTCKRHDWRAEAMAAREAIEAARGEHGKGRPGSGCKTCEALARYDATRRRP